MYLYLILTIVLTLAGKILYDSTSLRTKEHDFTRTDTQKPLTILFFSDLHYRYFWIRKKVLLNRLKDRPADLVIFGGDLGYKDADEAFRWLTDLHEDLKELWDKPDLPPILGVWGNHDARIPRSQGRSSAYYFIENETFDLQHAGITWTILGLGDLKTGRSKINEFLSGDVAFDDPEHSILLAHNPDTFLLDVPRARLALAGHYHGGQIRLPFHLEFKLLRPSDKLAKDGVIEGFHILDGQDTLISPGIGNTFLPFRFFSQATIHYIKL